MYVDESAQRSPIYSLWPSGAMKQQRSGSTLTQVMACCLTAPSHYLNQCWLIISEVKWHSFESNIMRYLSHQSFDSWFSNATWRHSPELTLAQVMAFCLKAPSHYLNQCWVTISEVQQQLSSNFTKDTSAINHQNRLEITKSDLCRCRHGRRQYLLTYSNRLHIP